MVIISHDARLLTRVCDDGALAWGRETGLFVGGLIMGRGSAGMFSNMHSTEQFVALVAASVPAPTCMFLPCPLHPAEKSEVWIVEDGGVHPWHFFC